MRQYLWLARFLAGGLKIAKTCQVPELIHTLLDSIAIYDILLA